MKRKRTLVREVNKHLICELCNGYFIEATTIVECLHTFCRSCLVKYLENNKFCPTCDVQLQKTNPLQSVRGDALLQQLVYKIVPGLYAKEMARRRKYYSELGGPSSDPDCSVYPISDKYFSPEDSISLSLEFIPNGKKPEDEVTNGEESLDKQGILHRRYLQCPAAVTMSHLKKFLRMKYGLNHDHNVDIIYDNEVLVDDFSLMDVAYTFIWKKDTPMRFKFRLMERNTVTKHLKRKVTVQSLLPPPNKDIKTEIAKKTLCVHIQSLPDQSDTAKTESSKKKNGLLKRVHEDNEKHENDIKRIKIAKEEKENHEENSNKKIKKDEEKRLELEKKEREKQEERARKEVEKRKEKEKHDEKMARREMEKEERILRRERGQEKIIFESKRLKNKERPNYSEDIEEEEDEDVLAINDDVVIEEKLSDLMADIKSKDLQRSEERKREKKKAKKAKHHHHHRHHDRKRDSPPAATILHSPVNDIMKLKIKLTDINPKPKYTVVESGEKEKENGHHKEEKIKRKEEARELVNNNTIKEDAEVKKLVKPQTYQKTQRPVPSAKPMQIVPKPVPSPSPKPVSSPAPSPKPAPPSPKPAQSPIPKLNPSLSSPKHATITKQNGAIKQEPMKAPQSSITVSKITAAEKLHLEKQKNKNVTNGVEIKRPSLEIMLVNAPKKTDEKPVEVKKTIRPTPPSIPLRLHKPNFGKKSPPPLVPTGTKISPHDESGALDLSGKSSRKSPDEPLKNLLTLSETASHVRNMMNQDSPTLKIPVPPTTSLLKTTYPSQRTIKPAQNPTVRQIPNPSALLFRQQHNLNGRSLPAAVPINSLRKYESYNKNIEKVAAGLTVKAALEAGYAVK